MPDSFDPARVRRRPLPALLLALLTVGCAAAQNQGPAPTAAPPAATGAPGATAAPEEPAPTPAEARDEAAPPSPGYTPHRIYDTAAGRFIDFETLAARGAGMDVVFFGERHGHGPTHRMQHALLEALSRRGDATLSMEMFERDVAPLLAAYVSGSAPLDSLVAGARPWPRFTEDYQPLVDFSRGREWEVVAANVPRRLASLVAQEGLDALDELEPGERAHAAADVRCPDDSYRTRFLEEMRRHPMGEAASPEAEEAREQRYYESQCLKDETMAEAIAQALAAGGARPVVHVTGSFHSDRGEGIPLRLLRRRPDASVAILTIVPVPDLDAIDPEVDAARADYLLYTLER